MEDIRYTLSRGVGGGGETTGSLHVDTPHQGFRNVLSIPKDKNINGFNPIRCIQNNEEGAMTKKYYTCGQNDEEK